MNKLSFFIKNHRRTISVFICISFFFLFLLTTIDFPEITKTVNISKVVPDDTQDNKYSFKYFPRLWNSSHDSNNAPSRSQVMLYENGKPLIPHSVHQEIRILGGGRFSYWNKALYFSSSDNTDPRYNRKTYILKHPFLGWRLQFIIHKLLILYIIGFIVFIANKYKSLIIKPEKTFLQNVLSLALYRSYLKSIIINIYKKKKIIVLIISLLTTSLFIMTLLPLPLLTASVN